MSAVPITIEIPDKLRGKWLMYVGPDYENQTMVTPEILADQEDLHAFDSLEELNKAFKDSQTGMVGPQSCQIFDPSGQRYFG